MDAEPDQGQWLERASGFFLVLGFAIAAIILTLAVAVAIVLHYFLSTGLGPD